MDFTKFGLTQEQQDALKREYDADVSGLKAKNDELLAKQQELKQEKTDHAKAVADAKADADAAAKAAEAAEVKRLAAEGDMQALKEHFAAEQAKRNAELEEALASRDAIEDSKLITDAVSQVKTIFTAEAQGPLTPMLKGLIKVNRPDGGSASLAFEHGGKSYDSVGSLTEALKSDQSLSSFIAQSKSSGGGGSGNTGSSNQDYSGMNATQRILAKKKQKG